MSTRACALLAVVPAFVAAALALLPWVSLEDRGIPMRWSGLAFYLGDDIGTVPAIVPLGCSTERALLAGLASSLKVPLFSPD